MAQRSENDERGGSPPVIDWICHSMAGSSSSESEEGYPFETITQAISKLEQLEKENITCDLLELSDGRYRPSGSSISDLSIEELCNEIQVYPEEVLKHQIYRDLEREYRDCERLYLLRNIFPFA